MLEAARRGRRLGGAGIAIAVAAVLAVTSCSDSPPDQHPGAPTTASSSVPAAASSSVPAAASKTVGDLGSREPAVVRAAVAAEVADRITGDSLAPAGTRIAVRPGTWQQKGATARLSAVVTVPHYPPVTRMFYLVQEHGRWLVLFSDAG